MTHDYFDVLRQGIRIPRNLYFLEREAVLLEKVLSIAPKQVGDEFFPTLGIRRSVQDGDGIDSLGRDRGWEAQRRYLGVYGFCRIEEANIQFARLQKSGQKVLWDGRPTHDF